MEQPGFIHDMLDVKVLVLYVMARVLYPVDAQKLYELCYQDDTLSYFDLQAALPQMLDSGHLERDDRGEYVITDKGRETCGLLEDTLAYPVAQRAGKAVERFNRQVRRDNLIRTEILPRQGGDYSVIMGLDDDRGCLMTLELMAPTKHQARCLASAFHENAEQIYQSLMKRLVDEREEKAQD